MATKATATRIQVDLMDIGARASGTCVEGHWMPYSAARLLRRAKGAVDFDLLHVFVLKSRSI
jgi:hypothetical protein